jgi:hypothetical protein
VALYFAFLFRIKAVPSTVLPWTEFIYRLLPPPTTGIVNGVLILTLAAIVRALYGIEAAIREANRSHSEAGLVSSSIPRQKSKRCSR